MKLIGLCLVRNEDWILRTSMEAGLRWCDGLAVVDHASTDMTRSIITSMALETGRVDFKFHDDASKWDEMNLREETLQMGRKMGGTHFAIIDADEIITANLIDKIRPEFEKLEPAQCIEVPMLAMRTLDVYQDDDSIWSSVWLTLGFANAPSLTWSPAEDGYQHHSRPPRRYTSVRRFLKNKSEGGVMHAQWCHKRRIKAKHVLYRMVDFLRWPDRESKDHLNWKYTLALVPPGHLGAAPEEWWAGHNKQAIKLDGVPWQEAEIRRLLEIHGRQKFDGLDLLGF